MHPKQTMVSGKGLLSVTFPSAPGIFQQMLPWNGELATRGPDQWPKTR